MLLLPEDNNVIVVLCVRIDERLSRAARAVCSPPPVGNAALFTTRRAPRALSCLVRWLAYGPRSEGMTRGKHFYLNDKLNNLYVKEIGGDQFF